MASTQRRINKLKQSPESWKIGYAMTGTSLLRNSSPRRHPRGSQATHTGEKRREVSPKPGKEDHCLLEGATGRLVQGHSSVGIRARGTAFSGERGILGDKVPLLRCDGHKYAACAIVSSIGCAWSTRSPAPLNGCRSATKWKAKLPSTPTGTFEWTW